jgi:hypothetical protein
MKKRHRFLIPLFLASVVLHAQPADTEIKTVANYNNWGWTSIVQKNDLVTLATVPAIGGRIMQYDLGDHPNMYINPGEIGKTYTPARGGLHSYGGYVMWPAPQYRWPGTWPPPPVLDYGPYESAITCDTADSNCLSVSSAIEKWVVPDIRFERKMTLYKATTRVRLEQILINESSEIKNLSIWDVTQTIAKNPRDNYWVYFPINTNSEHEYGVYFRDNLDSDAWVGEVAPGIYGVVFRPEGKKLFADPPQGWIAYVDEGAGKAYIKMFPVFEGAEYPGDTGGGRAQVYLGGANYEVEVASPLVDINPNGGRYTFTQNWYLTTIHGPVLSVNEMGAAQERLHKDGNTGRLKGAYGVFYAGTARLIAVDAGGTMLAQSASYDITPLETWNIDASLELPDATESVKIMVSDAGGKEIGTLESLTKKQLTGVNRQNYTPGTFALDQNYPNPFNPETVISYTLPSHQEIRLDVYDVTGRLMRTLVHEKQSAGNYKVPFNGRNLASGIYLIRLETVQQVMTRRMVLLK